MLPFMAAPQVECKAKAVPEVPLAILGSGEGKVMEISSGIVSDVVDYLQPLLTPYESVFYWYAIRNSIVRNGVPHVRLGKSIRKGIVSKSSYSATSKNCISEAKFREVFRSLESIGAIKKEGEPNRDGTLYRVFVPGGIEACREVKVACLPRCDYRDVDYYNIPSNRVTVYERDNYQCRYCGKQLTLKTIMLDHVQAVSRGGDNSFENLVAACFGCNSSKRANDAKLIPL